MEVLATRSYNLPDGWNCSVAEVWEFGFLLKCCCPSNVHTSKVQPLLSEGHFGNPPQHRLLWSVVGSALALTSRGFIFGSAVTGSWGQRKFPTGRLWSINNFNAPSKPSLWPFAPSPVLPDKWARLQSRDGQEKQKQTLQLPHRQHASWGIFGCCYWGACWCRDGRCQPLPSSYLPNFCACLTLEQIHWAKPWSISDWCSGKQDWAFSNSNPVATAASWTHSS